MRSVYGTSYAKGGIYGTPIASRMTTSRIPANPRVVTPKIVKRDGGAIKEWEAGNKNDDLLED